MHRRLFSYYPGYPLLCDDITQNARGRGECLVNCLAFEQALPDPIWASEASREGPPLSRLLSRASRGYFSRYPPNGELARRL